MKKIIYVSFKLFKSREGSIEHTKNIVQFLQRYNNVFFILHKSSKKFLNIFNKKNVFFYGNDNDKIFSNETFQQLYLFARYYKFFYKYFKTLNLYNDEKIIYTRATLVSPLIIFVFNKFFKINCFVHEHNGIFYYDAMMEGKSYLKHVYDYSQYLTVKYSNDNRVVTPQIRKYFVKKYNLNNSFVIGNGFDPTLFCKNYYLKIADQDKINKNEIKLLFVGNLVKWQGVNDIIKAIKIIKNNSLLNKDIKLEIIGNGREVNSLKKLVGDAYLENNVFFWGEKDKEFVVFKLFDADILCAPFKADRNNIVGNSALKIREYLATGKPILASDINYDIDLSKYAILFKPGNIDDLVDKLVKLINNYEDYLYKSKKNVNFVFNNLTWEKITDLLYERLMNVQCFKK